MSEPEYKTTEQQRCTAMVNGTRDGMALGDAYVPCNLPIGGYGPCAVCREPLEPWGLVGMRWHSPDEDPDDWHGLHHPYQPSQWRHVGLFTDAHGIPRGSREPDHEAKP